ncbi:hypothetical protein VOLCADRAFT_103476 [Volvox carteri f. nagariensis]|uniref:Cysteine dioxygenase n=1 Tax=Volvox carteri f. nagariensis TaxID=3068 RepID=D8TM52_VOLCA|nr:uncharacterized protein VOLCADRAFT_103476 [Volvox carteri f. nagariensis]EFJ51443.1 hypothetical protein VOLCADRAFT_103476 [Volvox carteri f. nagariensis]|eukprot:XP_002947395.1 hypothetical protein VOLCADRAFT_103476 [Volvox carteri f. nagariensis]
MYPASQPLRDVMQSVTQLPHCNMTAASAPASLAFARTVLTVLTQAASRLDDRHNHPARRTAAGGKQLLLASAVAAPPPAWFGPLATNAGGVLVFNLTDKQTAFEARIWQSDDVLNTQHIIQQHQPAADNGDGDDGTPAAETADNGQQNGNGGHQHHPSDSASDQIGQQTNRAAPVVDITGNALSVCYSSKPSLLLSVHTPKAPEGYSVELFLCKPGTGGQPEQRQKLEPRTIEVLKPAKAFAVALRPSNRTYWLSYDRAHKCIKYGRGYHMEETTEMTWDLDLDKDTAEQLFGSGVKMATLTATPFPSGGDKPLVGVDAARPRVQFDRLPLTKNRPPKVKDSAQLTLDDLDNPQFTFSADLPAACQVLYRNVTGSGIALDDELVNAIRYSIVTPGKTLYEILSKKDKEFGYLRITLGNELGDGPGIPYVVEIWPGNSKSPIHNHGNVCAVIRVLHGSISVQVHNELAEDLADDNANSSSSSSSSAREILPLTEVELVKGDVTWMDANWYQCHQLKNKAKDRGNFCATLQCYKYDEEDRIVWPYFDYIEDGSLHLFTPDTDLTYGCLTVSCTLDCTLTRLYSFQSHYQDDRQADSTTRQQFFSV